MNAQNIIEKIQSGEDAHTEFKSSFGTGVLESLVAFANGSGIRRIIWLFEEAKLSQPLFQNISDGFMVTVFSDNDADLNNVGLNVGLNDGLNVGLNPKEKRLQQILELIEHNKAISANELAMNLNVQKRTIERDIDELKKQKRLQRTGSRKTGKWIIIPIE